MCYGCVQLGVSMFVCWYDIVLVCVLVWFEVVCWFAVCFWFDVGLWLGFRFVVGFWLDSGWFQVGFRLV